MKVFHLTTNETAEKILADGNVTCSAVHFRQNSRQKFLVQRTTLDIENNDGLIEATERKKSGL